MGNSRLFGSRKANTGVSQRVRDGLGQHFSDPEMESISRFGSLIEVAAGRPLMTEDQRGTEAFIMVSGVVEVCRHEGPVIILGAGDVVGEGALLSGGRRNADVIAKTDVAMFVFTSREFSSLLTQSHTLNSRVKQVAAARTCPTT